MKLNVNNALPFLNKDIKSLQSKVTNIHNELHNKTKYSNYLGWMDLPFTKEEKLDHIIEVANKVKEQSEVLVIIGVGGSYVGSKAGIDFLEKPFNNQNIEIIYAGHNLSGRYLKNLLIYLENKQFSVNVISKSGTTTEPAIAFRLIKKLLIKKYGNNYHKRVIATTDAKKGSLYTLAKKENYYMFEIPDDVGGRFSVLTAVGLFPFAVMGYDIKEMIKGSKEAFNRYNTDNILTNDAYLYAVTRYLLYKSGKKIEMLVNFEPNLHSFSEWWKQLFAESEGKNKQGLFVTSAKYATDLHSIGQYIQDGERHLFETIINIKHIEDDLTIHKLEEDIDNLNYLSNKSLNYINQKALEGTILAHVDGNVPVINIDLPNISEHSFGQLVYFFELACAMSANLLEVNPFDQPGVEKYKNNMFKLLGKPGY